MSDTEEVETKPRRSYVSSLPSDYSDVQPKNYDPEFISAISNQMQVPDSIPVLKQDDTEFSTMRNEGWGTRGMVDDKSRYMNVPERILLAGGGRHIEGRPEIEGLNFEDMGRGYDVGLQTPPRTLTLDEQFPSLEQRRETRDDDDEYGDDDNDDEREEGGNENFNARLPNGTALVRPMPVKASPEDSMYLSLADDNDAVQFKKEIMRLHQRLNRLERDQDVQNSRNKVMAGAAVSYFALKFLFWFFRTNK